MSCGSCSSSKNDPMGCRSGGCKSGGCNRLNVYDWLSDISFSSTHETTNIVEVSFKNGSRKGFYKNISHIDCNTGDTVVVETTTGGYDIGKISLSGELVRLQMKKKRMRKNAEIPRIIRKANPNDLENWHYAVQQEHNTMLMARVIARDLKLDMKIGDVEYQGDGRKATFFYTADDRIDFRDLIKLFAKEFRVKIEMRQIGVRQEAGRVGGIGSCGRELCCSTWLTEFKSVSTLAARYQNLSINQSKLSGQCGRLKCCLNYELDTYLDALKAFPRNADYIETEKGRLKLVKTDIFKGLLFYSFHNETKQYGLNVQAVKTILQMNHTGKKPADIAQFTTTATTNKTEQRSWANFMQEQKTGNNNADSFKTYEQDLDQALKHDKDKRKQDKKTKSKPKNKPKNPNETPNNKAIPPLTAAPQPNLKQNAPTPNNPTTPNNNTPPPPRPKTQQPQHRPPPQTPPIKQQHPNPENQRNNNPPQQSKPTNNNKKPKNNNPVPPPPQA